MTSEALVLSNSYRNAAGLLWDAALAAYARAEIDALGLRRIELEVYYPLLAHALDIVTRDALAGHAALEPLVAQIRTATKELEHGLKHAERVVDLPAFGLRLVAAAASVAAFVAAPSPASALIAVSAIASAVRSLAG